VRILPRAKCPPSLIFHWKLKTEKSLLVFMLLTRLYYALLNVDNLFALIELFALFLLISCFLYYVKPGNLHAWMTKHLLQFHIIFVFRREVIYAQATDENVNSLFI